MNKFVAIVVLMVVASVSAKPSVLAPAAVAYASPLVAAAPLPYVAATSSQVVARNYNGFAVAPAPLIAAAPAIAAPALVSPYASPYASFSRFAAAPVPLAGSPFAYNSPLAYNGLPFSAAAAATPYVW